MTISSSSRLIISDNNINRIKSKTRVTYIKCIMLNPLDLTIFSKFPNLLELDLTDNNITDISKLPSLPNLKYLILLIIP